MYALDTNILIHYAKNEPGVTNQIEKWVMLSEALLISTVVEAELFSFAKLSDEETNSLENALELFTIIPVDSSLARLAANIRQAYKTHLLDAIVAATAIAYNAPLVTRNIKDFEKITEIKLLKV